MSDFASDPSDDGATNGRTPAIDLSSLEEQSDATTLVSLTSASIHARTRPIAILIYYLWEALLALVIAWPIISLVRTTYGRHPDGDAALWDPGGLNLIEFAIHSKESAAALTSPGVILALAGTIIGLVPLGALLAAITHSRGSQRAPSIRASFVRAVEAFHPMLVVAFIAIVLEGILIFAAIVAFTAISGGLSTNGGEVRADKIAIAIGLAIAATACVVGVLRDLASAAIVRFRLRALPAIGIAIETFSTRVAVSLWSWTWRAVSSIVPFLIAFFVADRLGGRGGSTLLILAVLHQVVILARAALRASWLAQAARLVGRDRSRRP